MNKYVLKNSDGICFSCVIDPEKEADQWLAVFAIQKGQGYTAERWGDQVKILDYFHGDTQAVFQILSVTDTDEPPTLTLTKLA